MPPKRKSSKKKKQLKPSALDAAAALDDDDIEYGGGDTSSGSSGFRESPLYRDVERFEDEEPARNNDLLISTDPATGRPYSEGKRQRPRCLAVLLVLIMIVLLSAGFAALAYHIIKAVETNQFTTSFQTDVEVLLRAFGENLQQTLESADDLATNLTTYASESGSQWPYVTLPGFCQHAQDLLLQSQSLFSLGVAPLVPLKQRAEWEDYARKNHQRWLSDCSIDKIESAATDDDEADQPLINTHYTVTYEIVDIKGRPLHNASWCFEQHDDADATTTQCYYQPKWQSAPILANHGQKSKSYPFNLDITQHNQWTRAAMHAYHSQQAVIAGYGSVLDPTVDLAHKKQQRKEQEWMKEFTGQHHQYGTQPTGSLAYPIVYHQPVSEAQELKSKPNQFPADVVGAVTFTFYWKRLIQEVSKIHSRGVILVFGQEDCGPSFSYKLDGSVATYLGVGDFGKGDYLSSPDALPSPLSDNSDYSFLEYKANMADLVQDTEAANQYTGLPLSSDYCAKTVTAYPTAETEAAYRTNAPMKYAIVTGSGVLVIGLMLFAYDYCSRSSKRTKHVATTKAAPLPPPPPPPPPPPSPKRVSSKSPERRESASKRIVASIQSMFRKSDGTAMGQDYKETTVMICDLTRFDEWKAQRSRAEVFGLLEILFRAFDKIASRQGVCRIETHGNRYVAVCGAPVEQKDHALCMVRFAQACIEKLGILVKGLVGPFGEDVAHIGLRIGLHSGSSRTALVGEQHARLRLLGGAIITATTMMNHGQEGKIHVSHTTADEIIKSGFGKWLTRRKNIRASIVRRTDGSGSVTSADTTAAAAEHVCTYWVAASTSRRRSVDHMTTTSGSSSGNQSSFRLSPTPTPGATRRLSAHGGGGRMDSVTLFSKTELPLCEEGGELNIEATTDFVMTPKGPKSRSFRDITRKDMTLAPELSPMRRPAAQQKPPPPPPLALPLEVLPPELPPTAEERQKAKKRPSGVSLADHFDRHEADFDSLEDEDDFEEGKSLNVGSLDAGGLDIAKFMKSSQEFSSLLDDEDTSEAFDHLSASTTQLMAKFLQHDLPPGGPGGGGGGGEFT